MRRRENLWLGALAIGVVGCATTSGVTTTQAPAPIEHRATVAQAAPTQSAPLRRGLRFRIQPSDTEVYVDEQRRGIAGEVGGGTGVLELGPGIHRISLKRVGYQTWRGEVTVSERIELLDVALEKRR